jgi:RNA polymerase sigma-70 factor (ECF subfamily)
MSTQADVYAGSEVELVQGLLRRDERAWRAMHERYGRLIYRCISDVLRPFASRLSSDAAHDVHATFLLALHERDMHKLRVFDPDKGRSFSSWLGRLASNCAVDHVRKNARWISIELDETTLDPAPSPDTHRALVARMRLDVVRDAAQKLTDRDQELLVLVFDAALEPDAIATRMGVSVKTVYSKSHKIREKLRTALVDAHLAAA